jgi:hypothetical protein
MANGSPRKRKRKAAGPKLAPLVPMPMVQPLSDSEWQPFLELLPSRSRSAILRHKLDELLATYLGCLDGEARSPSSREVAVVLADVEERAHQFAKHLFMLDVRARNQEEERFNTANEVAADILTKASVRPEGRPVLDAAIRANEILARVASREAKKLGERSKKGRPVRGGTTAWMLQRLIELLRENELDIPARPKSDNPVCVLSKHFLKLARIRARDLKGSKWASQEIGHELMVTDRIFLSRLRRAAQTESES